MSVPRRFWGLPRTESEGLTCHPASDVRPSSVYGQCFGVGGPPPQSYRPRVGTLRSFGEKTKDVAPGISVDYGSCSRTFPIFP